MSNTSSVSGRIDLKKRKNCFTTATGKEEWETVSLLPRTLIGEWSPCPYLNAQAFFSLCFCPHFAEKAQWESAMAVLSSLLVFNHQSYTFNGIYFRSTDQCIVVNFFFHEVSSRKRSIAITFISQTGSQSLEIFLLKDIFLFKISDKESRHRLEPMNNKSCELSHSSNYLPSNYTAV